MTSRPPESNAPAPGSPAPGSHAPGSPVPLAQVLRSDEVESLHAGWLVLVDADGQILAQFGDDAPIYTRSSLKPLQALPLIATGGADRWGLTPEELAVTAASHAGSRMHRETVMSLLSKAGLSADQLECGTHMPYDEEAARDLLCRGEAPTLLHCNCSGKHAGMLALARHMGWPTEGYHRLEHPVQQAVREAVLAVTGVSPDALSHGIDGCGLPVWRMPISALARAFARLGRPETLPAPWQEPARRIVEAMAAHPERVSGPGRFDTELMRLTGGRLVGKGGGEAVHAGIVRDRGWGWALKVADGNRRATPPALLALLDRLGGLTAEDRESLSRWMRPELSNNRQETVGAIVPAPSLTLS
ncbi:L-asparaginase II [compost metagenome]